METVEARLSTLEEENRQLRITVRRQGKLIRNALVCVGFLLLLGTLGAGFGPGGAVSPLIKAKKIVVTDPAGTKDLIVLEAAGESVSVGNPTATILIKNNDGDTTGVVGRWKDGGTGLLFGANGKDMKYSVGMNSSLHSSIVYLQGNGGGNTPFNAYVTEDDDATLSFVRRTDGKKQFDVRTVKNIPTMRLFDKEGKAKYLFTLDAKGAPIFRVQDAELTELKSVAVESLPRFQLKDGQVVVKVAK